MKKADPTEPVPREPVALANQIRQEANRLVDGADAVIAKFQTQLAHDPFRAFEWAEDAMQAAAAREVASRFLGSVERDTAAGHSPREVLAGSRSDISRMILREAQFPTNGSGSHTAMARTLQIAWCKLLERLDDLIEPPPGYYSDDVQNQETKGTK